MLSGSARSKERKKMRRYNGKCDIFSGIRAQIEEGRNGGAVQQRDQ